MVSVKFFAIRNLCSLFLVLSFHRKISDLPDEDWNDFGSERKETGRGTPVSGRTSTDSYDSGYSSFQPSSPVKARKGRKASRSIKSDSNDCTLVRCFRIFHATKI